MRNIKTSLRFVRKSALLFVAASGMSYLTACQSEQVVDNPNDNNIPETPLNSASYSVFGGNQSRVTNYGAGSTRAGEYVPASESFTMDAEETVAAAAANALSIKDVPLNEAWRLDQAPYQGASVLIDKDFGQFGVSVASKYYIQAGVTLDFSNGFNGFAAGSEIYVLPGAKFKIGSTLPTGLTLYNYGELVVANGLCVAGNLYSAADLYIPGQGLYNGALGVNAGAGLYCKGSVYADYISQLNGEVVACEIQVGKHWIFDGTGTVKTGYICAKAEKDGDPAVKLEFNAGNVVLDNNGLVEADQIYCSNSETRFTVNGTNAVVAAVVFDTNNAAWPAKIFNSAIAVDFGDITISGKPDAYLDDKYYEKFTKNDLGLQTSSENQVVWVPAAGCHGEYGQKPENNPGGNDNTGNGDDDTGNDDPTVTVPDDPSDPIVTPELVKIVDIEGLDDEINHGDHDHGIISATCINFGADGTAYASYHLRGNGTGDHNQPNYVGEYAQKGCIEVIKDNGAAGMELGSYMIAPDWDFNHLIVDGNRIVTVGNQKKMGAFIGTLPVDFEASVGTDRDDFQVKELTTAEAIYGTSDKTGNEIKIGYKNAGDGNCVVRQGNYYYVATYRGYGPLNLDFTRVKNEAGDVVFTPTNGSAKHISINGGNMAVIALDSYDKTSSTASVYTFGASDYTFANVLASYNAIGTVSPVDGKNVIAVDGNEIYACLSKGGLVRVSDGKKWQRGQNKSVPVNGMAFDDKYIYVANGSFVSVLDKATMNEICYYHAASQKSANYIALRNGKIYVAFGEDGIQVFQLVEKEIAQQ